MAGDSLGHYRDLQPIGAGGMGEVFVAHDARLDRKVALKVLPASVRAWPATTGSCISRMPRRALTSG